MFFNSIDWQWFTNSPTDLITEPATYVDMNVTVIPDWNTSVFLEWSAPDVEDNLTDNPQYMIYYSESELGPFTQITSQPITDTSYYTTWQVQDSKVYEMYFSIEVIYPVTGNTYRSYPKSPSLGLPKWHVLRHKDIIRREAILLDKFVGADTIVYTRKREGKRCKECWDPVHKKVFRDHCPSCYGTSYEGGYDTGMKTKLQYTSIDPQSQFSYQGREEPIMISAWGLPFPLLHPQAILCRLGDRRIFRIEGHQGSTEMLTNVQRQTVVLKELSRDSIENKLFNRTDYIEVPVRKPHKHH